MDRDGLILDTLNRLENKVDTGFKEYGERLARVETLIDERTSKQRRREMLSRSTWTTIISGGIIGLWEILRSKVLRP